MLGVGKENAETTSRFYTLKRTNMVSLPCDHAKKDKCSVRERGREVVVVVGRELPVGGKAMAPTHTPGRILLAFAAG